MTKHKKSSQRPLRKMAVLLFDLEKAFDCIPRDRAFSELSEMAGSNGLKLKREDLHRAPVICFWGKMEKSARNCAYLEECGKDLLKVLYNAIMDEVKDARGSEGLQAVWASDNNDESEEEEEEEWLDISEVAFVDDMLSFLTYGTEEEVEAWATKVVECFEIFEMKANVSKLEILVVAWGKGSKPISRRVARGRLKFNVRVITIKATTSAKHLGTKIDMKASSQKEVNARVQAASQALPD